MPSTMSTFLKEQSCLPGASSSSPGGKREMTGKLWQMEKPNLVRGQQRYGNVGEMAGRRRLISGER